MSPRVNRRLAAGAAAIVLAGLAVPAATASGSNTDSDTEAAPTGSAYYQVDLAEGQTPQDVANTGADITYVKDGSVEIVADEAGAEQLRDKGLDVHRINELHAENPGFSSKEEGTYYGGYHTAAAHSEHNAKVAEEHPELVKKFTIGESYLKKQGQGGHDIEALCITKDAGNGDNCAKTTAGKPKMLLQGQIHARELSTGELAYKWIDELVTSDDPEIQELLETRELWVVPMLNPDGVDIVSQEPDNPLPQRKNANEEAASFDECGISGGSQAGVDLNRNSSFAWDANEGGPCDQTFPGASEASEPETQAIEGLMSEIFEDKRDDDLDAPVKDGANGVFLTLHSYSNLIIHPYSFTNDTQAPDRDALNALGNKMAESNGYEVGTAGEVIGYTAPGGTDDWAYGKLGVPGYTFEVGNEGSAESCGGFFPVYSCMDQFWEENRGAFITAAQAADDPYGQKAARSNEN